ncbi:MAG: hypothetical protein U0575_07470 [Phycisphaerales bacterium]
MPQSLNVRPRIRASRLARVASITLAPVLACLAIAGFAIADDKPGSPAAPAGKAPAAAPAAASAAAAPKAGSPDDGVPDIYFVPIKGQMGTDVHINVYKDVVKDIKAKKPDLVVFVMNCADENNNYYLPDDDPVERSKLMLTEFRDIAEMLHNELRDIPQAMWIDDSLGFSSLLAMAWPDIYMTSTARLGGLGRVMEPIARWKDPDVRPKMLAAVTGICKGFFELGGWPQELGEAMMRPEKFLSVSFEGRTLKWANDTAGGWVIDGNDKAAARFSAQLAEDIGLCKGIADSKDDLAFLMGYREWREVPGGEKIVDDYIEGWRRSLKQATEWATEYQDAMKYASGTDAVKYLGQAKSALQKILGAMNQYPAVEIRWRDVRGETKLTIQTYIDRISEMIR